ncbi:lipase 3 isoform X2 [Fopius arisanus]|uniref:Lip3_1 protein n=1 Tax=Fopius arisanus TaxID=64838 RepID=A0A0C9RAS5_9HYME|nr:PREDICTED: lipase 3-like isoform X2 [Fopius arisanus]
MEKLLIAVLWTSCAIAVTFGGKINTGNDYLHTPGKTSFQLGILPEYEVQRYVFPLVLPDSEADVESGEEFGETVLHRILRGPRSDFSEDKRPALIQHGILCDVYSCTANKPQIAVAYLLVDQGYDVWLGSSNYSTGANFLSNQTMENDKFENVAQFILITTQQPELLVMGSSNGTVQFFAIPARYRHEPSKFSKLLENIPGVKTAKRWYSKLFRKGWGYLSRGYDRVQESVERIGKKLDYMVDNPFVSKLQNTVMSAWGIVSTVKPTLRVHDFSKMLNHPDVYLDTPQLISKYGYSVETHWVKTEDGYLLALHRIPGGKKYPAKPGKPVVLLQHGILASSAIWVLAGPSKGLAYILADKGYDVWMGNSRGSTYSRGHEELLTTNHEYWEFSFHEMGIYDLPATIDYILDETKQEKIYCLGHSQGTTSFFVMMSEKPEYNNKIYKLAAYAPIVYMTNIRSPFLKFAAGLTSPIYRTLQFFHVYDLAPTNALLTNIGRDTCEARSLYQVVCSNSLFMITGYDTAQINQTLVPIILGHLPAGSSVKQFMHFAQEIKAKKFRQFDYNDARVNQEKYGQSEPPEYNINNTRIPVAIFYANNDLLSDKRDVEKLAEDLPNTEMVYKVPMEAFNHIDFMFAIDAPALLYQPTIEFFNATFTPPII